ncbi:MAG: hypothetical protein HRU07_06055 [Nitrosopumilus sp.]|nr:hypothetical protein [Nitrosopumilus sp.]NRA05708.1 hypothetical protein [Nitrosopumilus sp.]
MNNSVIALESLNHEVSSMAQHSINEGREYLNELEIQHLIKMTNNVVMKIKTQVLEIQL